MKNGIEEGYSVAPSYSISAGALIMMGTIQQVGYVLSWVKLVMQWDICLCRALEANGHLERHSMLQVFDKRLMEWSECPCASQEYAPGDFRAPFGSFQSPFCQNLCFIKEAYPSVFPPP